MKITNLENAAVAYENGFRRAVLSIWHTDGRILFVVRFAGRSRTFKTRNGAEGYAVRVVSDFDPEIVNGVDCDGRTFGR